MMLRRFKFYVLYAFTIFGGAMVLISCQTTSSPSGSAGVFVPDTPSYVSAAPMEISQEKRNQQKELEGYVARTSDRRLMHLPKDLDLTLSGALRKTTKVEFIEPEETFERHTIPLRMTDYSVDYRSTLGTTTYYSPGIR